MAEPAFSLCVYCGSRTGAPDVSPTRRAPWANGSAATAGNWSTAAAAAASWALVALATPAAGGRVVGVIPQSLVDREFANHACDELHIVQTMHERKALMAERSSAFLVLPGGIGTFEELFEVWTWRQLGYHDKPIGLLECGGLLRRPARLSAHAA